MLECTQEQEDNEMETSTSKLEIHRSIIEVRRRIKFVESIFSGDKNVFHGQPVWDIFHPDSNDEELEDGEFYTLAQRLINLESEHLAPLGASAAALELSGTEEKEVQDLRKRMNSAARKISLRLKESKGMDPGEYAGLRALALEEMIEQAETEMKRDAKIMRCNKIKRWISRLGGWMYRTVLFAGAAWAVLFRLIPELLNIVTYYLK